MDQEPTVDFEDPRIKAIVLKALTEAFFVTFWAMYWGRSIYNLPDKESAWALATGRRQRD